MTTVILYTRVSTDEQGASGLGLEAQRDALIAEAERRGWDWVLSGDVASGKNAKRPGLTAALEALSAGAAQALMVSKLDRLSRSIVDFTNIVARAQREGWALVCMDIGVDTTTPSGEMIAHIMASLAQYERRLIGQRTSEALAAAKKRGTIVGRPVAVPEPVARLIRKERMKGASYRAIAEKLNARGIPTAQGGARWHASTVRSVAERVA